MRFRLLPLVFLPVLAACAVTPGDQEPTAHTESALSSQVLLIITDDALAPDLQRLAQYKTATGMPALVETISSLRYTAIQKGLSMDDTELVKREIAYAVQYMGTRYVLLGGDPSHVPVRHRTVWQADGMAIASRNPSDGYYSNLFKAHNPDGSNSGVFDDWDGNGNHEFNEEQWLAETAATINPDAVDGYPDVAVGRVPAASAAQMSTFVDKVILYETWGAAGMPGARRSAFLIDHDYAGADGFTGEIEGPMVTERGRNDHVGLSYASGDPLPPLFVSGNTASIAAEATNAAMLFYVGHGSGRTWGYNTFFDSANVAQLTNSGNYPIVFAAACETGGFAPNVIGSGTPDPTLASTSFASDWLFKSNGGGIAYFGETLVAEDNWGATLVTDMSRLIAAGNNVLGDVWRKAQIKYWSDMGKTNVIGAPRIYLGVMTMFGDPSLRLNVKFTNEQALRASDYDGDGRADPGIWRMGSALWALRNTSASWSQFYYGQNLDVAVSGDYDGDGKTDPALWRPSTGTWFLRTTTAPWSSVTYGANGDIPVPADYDGDGKTDIALFRPSLGHWFIQASGGGAWQQFDYGANGDIPVVADYDGDGLADAAVWRPSTGVWYIRTSGSPWQVVSYGAQGDVPVPADYDGDGKVDIAVYRPSLGRWFIQTSTAPWQVVDYGMQGDVPAPSDYDADGKADIAVFRPSTGHWYLRNSGSSWQDFAYGASGDVPLPRGH